MSTAVLPTQCLSMNGPLHKQIDKMRPAAGKKWTAKVDATSSGSAPLTALPTRSDKLAIAPKKPMRPLTGYHIFFQLEREYVIQSLAGDDADQSTADGKVCIPDVPVRYRDTRLSPDWYAGPGKRQKRKHRKQHGVISFLELSRVISQRWGQLEQVDPETKAFVTAIAKRELDEYYEEMREYKELVKDLDIVPEKKAKKKSPKRKSSEVSTAVAKRSKQSNKRGCPASPDASPSPNSVPSDQTLVSPPQSHRPSVVSSSSSSSDEDPDFEPLPASAQLETDIERFLSAIGIDHSPQSSGGCNLSDLPATVPAPKRRRASFLGHRRGSQASMLSLSFLDGPILDPIVFDDAGIDPICQFIDVTTVSDSESDADDGERSCPTSIECDMLDDEIVKLWQDEN
ncbi:hypothetical protein THAOC_35714 [Thalassiosira oceanica]|uniref:HMG box domain-containing protein n=1 Tax=Thalassiosira oceanica TaxID=159749 RepID=K0R0H2_THAOC|nr:hypothetical protein THAOC_35714 [Thalassiosira oceanica]|mmetsp:Transcript_28306/g.64411  ORF Transcript_28306/g.64411 Transcript_28306/m.64411 type:complete len:399 (+) Transcript_28306:157-1353(+)|eukprot:EJK45663.1 hypothetical protein THAOC_35714 [Thalassiosira oceanica]